VLRAVQQGYLYYFNPFYDVYDTTFELYRLDTATCEREHLRSIEHAGNDEKTTCLDLSLFIAGDEYAFALTLSPGDLPARVEVYDAGAGGDGLLHSAPTPSFITGGGVIYIDDAGLCQYKVADRSTTLLIDDAALLENICYVAGETDDWLYLSHVTTLQGAPGESAYAANEGLIRVRLVDGRPQTQTVFEGAFYK